MIQPKFFFGFVLLSLSLSLFSSADALRCETPPNMIGVVESVAKNPATSEQIIQLKDRRSFADQTDTAAKYNSQTVFLDTYTTVILAYKQALRAKALDIFGIPDQKFIAVEYLYKNNFPQNHDISVGDIVVHSGPATHCVPNLVGIFSAEGAIKHLKMTHNTYYDLRIGATEIKIEPGKRDRNNCSDQSMSLGCNTSVNWQLGSEIFSLQVGESHQPKNSLVSRIELSQAVVPEDIGGDDFWGLGKSLSYNITFGDSSHSLVSAQAEPVLPPNLWQQLWMIFFFNTNPPLSLLPVDSEKKVYEFTNKQWEITGFNGKKMNEKTFMTFGESQNYQPAVKVEPECNPLDWVQYEYDDYEQVLSFGKSAMPRTERSCVNGGIDFPFFRGLKVTFESSNKVVLTEAKILSESDKGVEIILETPDYTITPKAKTALESVFDDFLYGNPQADANIDVCWYNSEKIYQGSLDPLDKKIRLIDAHGTMVTTCDFESQNLDPLCTQTHSCQGVYRGVSSFRKEDNGRTDLYELSDGARTRAVAKEWVEVSVFAQCRQEPWEVEVVATKAEKIKLFFEEKNIPVYDVEIKSRGLVCEGCNCPSYNIKKILVDSNTKKNVVAILDSYPELFGYILEDHETRIDQKTTKALLARRFAQRILSHFELEISQSSIMVLTDSYKKFSVEQALFLENIQISFNFNQETGGFTEVKWKNLKTRKSGSMFSSKSELTWEELKVMLEKQLLKDSTNNEAKNISEKLLRTECEQKTGYSKTAYAVGWKNIFMEENNLTETEFEKYIDLKSVALDSLAKTCELKVSYDITKDWFSTQRIDQMTLGVPPEMRPSELIRESDPQTMGRMGVSTINLKVGWAFSSEDEVFAHLNQEYLNLNPPSSGLIQIEKQDFQYFWNYENGETVVAPGDPFVVARIKGLARGNQPATCYKIIVSLQTKNTSLAVVPCVIN